MIIRMYKMKKLFTFLLILTTVCLIAAGCSKNNGATTSAVESVTIKTLPTNTEYLFGEVFSFDGGTLSVKYSDGKETIINMTKDMCAKEVDTTVYGVYPLYLNVVVDGAYYEVSFEYEVVFENEKIQQFADMCHDFCALTEIEIEDIEKIRAAQKAYNKLSQENKTFITENAPLLIEKLEVYERYAIPVYFRDKKEQATKYYEGLNPVLFSSSSYVALTNYYNEFMNSSVADFDAVDDLYQSFKTRVSYIPKLEISLEDLRRETIEYFENRAKRNIYAVDDKGLFESDFVLVEVNYSDSEVIKACLNELETATEEQLDEGFAEIVKRFNDGYVQEFKKDAKKSLANLFTDWENTAVSKLSLWEQDAIALKGQFNNISVSYLEDNRWWIPQPYRLTSLRNSYAAKIDSAINVEEVNEYYDTYAFEITRAVLERNLEMVYIIDRNLNGGYDVSDGYYWGYIANHWGASPAQAFVYDGIIDEFVGEIYGTSDSNPYRLCMALYKNVTVADILKLPSRYAEILNTIKPDPKAIVSCEITTLPTKTIYDIGEEVSLAGGKVTIGYNDLTTEVIDLDGEQCEMGAVDNSTPGSKTVEIIVRANNEEKIVNFTYTIKGDEKWNALISAIAGLGEQSTLNDVLSVVAIYDAFGEDCAEFNQIFAEDYAKLCRIQEKFIVEYSRPKLLECDNVYETLPYYVYSETDRTALDQKYAEMKAATASATIFATVNTATQTFLAFVEALEVEQVDVATVKERLGQSLERIANVTIYNFASESATSITITEKTISLKDNEEVAQKIATLIASIDANSSVQAAIDAYQVGVEDVYASVINAYATYATQDVKALVDNMRNTVKYIWEEDGFEGTDNISLDYTVNVWEYLWWTPECYMVSTMLNKISVDACGSKQFTYEDYQLAYNDMIRSVMYRNMYTIFQYLLSIGEADEGFRWSALCAANGAAGQNVFPYDGVLDDYFGLTISTEYRLWGWGYNKDWKVTTLAELIEKYVADMDTLINK